MNRIFEYLEYRDYMRDHYHASKKQQTFLSFRYIEKKTGIDASYYAKVINRQKHIATDSIPALTTFFKFTRQEADYFTNLVSFCKAKKKEQIDYYFNKLIYLRDPSAKRLEEKKYRYFQEWQSVIIRELINIIPYNGDHHQLGRRLQPSITALQARKSVELLEELQLIEKNEDGFYRITNQFLTTDTKLRSIAVREFQKKMIHLAAEALDRFDQNQRDISSLTISTSRTCLELIREKLARTRKEILQLVSECEDDAEEVYQLNFQLFPVSKNSTFDGKKESHSPCE